MFHFVRHGNLWNGKTKRREGKLLRNVISIEIAADAGMRRRLYTFQRHPSEGPTNYVGLVCIRCNLDVQALRRLLPSCAPTTMPSTGSQPNWSWMNEEADANVLNGCASAAVASDDHEWT